MSILFCNGQDKIPDLFDIFPVSPQAATLGNYGNVPVNLSSGQLNYNVPLYTVKLQGIEIPIALSYNYSGYRVAEESGDFGLGWNLVGCGVVSRQVNIRPDESYKGFIGRNLIGQNYIIPALKNPDNTDLYEDIIENNYDTQSDKFNYSAPGINGSFFFNEERTPVLIPYKNYRITIPGIDDSNFSSIPEIKITDDLGNEYKFSKIEETETTSGDGLQTEIGTYRSAWFLTEIYIPKTDEKVEFKYKEYEYTKYVYAHSKSEMQNYSCPNYEKYSENVSSYTITSALLDSIIFPGGFVNIEREVIDGKIDKKISSIKINNNIENFLEYDFEYEYETDLLLNIQRGTQNKENYYSFSYYDMFEKTEDYNMQLAQDFWGYYNGNPEEYLISYKARKPNFEASLSGALKEIIYPTNGKTLIKYEPNQVYNKTIFNAKLKSALIHFNRDWSYIGPDLYVDTVIHIVDTLEFTSTASYSYFNYVDKTAESHFLIQQIECDPTNCSAFSSSLVGVDFTVPQTDSNSGTLNPGRYKVIIDCDVSGDGKVGTKINIKSYDANLNPEIEVGGIRVKQVNEYKNLTDANPSKTINYKYVDDDNGPSGRLLSTGLYEYTKIQYFTDGECSPVRQGEPSPWGANGMWGDYLDGSSGSVLFDYYPPAGGSGNGSLQCISAANGGVIYCWWEFNRYILSKSSVEYNYPNSFGDINMPNQKPLTIYYSSSITPLELYNSSPVYYSQVIEDVIDNETQEIHRTKRTFCENLTYPPIIPMRPMMPRNNQRGKLLKEEFYKMVDNEFEIIKKVENTYEEYQKEDKGEQVILEGLAYIETTVGTNTPGQYENFNFDPYPLISADDLLSEKVETNYLNDKTTVKNYYYIYDSNTMYIKESTLKDKNNVECEKSFIYYPNDFSSTIVNVSNLIDHNILNSPIRKEYYRNGKLASGIANKYNNLGSLTEVYSYENKQLLNPIAFNKNILIPENYILKAEYEYDENRKRLKEVREKDNYTKSILWGYNNTLPIAKVENADYALLSTALGTDIIESLAVSTNNEFINSKIALLRNDSRLKNALITNYNYKPLVGVIAQTDPNGVSTYYEYDDFNRLKNIKDNNRKLVKEYSYHIQDQVLDVPQVNEPNVVVKHNYIKITWDAVSKAESYTIYRSVNDGELNLIASNVTHTYYEDNSVQPNTKYKYVVKSVNKNFSSDFSKEFEIYSLLSPIEQIEGESSVCYGTTQNFSVASVPYADYYEWTAPAGATVYGQGQKDVSIQFGTSSGNISVKAKNNNTESAEKQLYVTINFVPEIQIQPANREVCLGIDAIFEVSATGSGLNYQWQYSSDGVNFNNCTTGTGINTANLTETGSVDKNGYKYRCKITGMCGSLYSETKTLTVNEPPQIIHQLSDKEVCPGASAAFSVVATGTDLHYLWKCSSDGINYNNCTLGADQEMDSPRYVDENTANKNGYKYICIVNSEKCEPSQTTNAATLFFTAPPTITEHPDNKTVCSGDPVTFSIVTNGTSYQWQRNNGFIIDPETFEHVGWEDCNSGTGTSFTESNTAEMDGYWYRCVVTGECGLTTASERAILTLNEKPIITSHPSNKIICPGESVTFNVSASNATTYQWRKNGIAISGATNSSYTITNATTAYEGNYDCLVSNDSDCGMLTSNQANLSFNTPPSISMQPLNKTVCPGSSAKFTITATGTGLNYQWQYSTNGTTFYNCNSGTGDDTQMYIETNTTGKNGYKYRCVVSGTCSPSVISNVVTLTFKTAPTISDQPDNTSVCSGNSAIFKVVGSGSGLSYQWQSGSSPISMSNCTSGTGIHSSTYTETSTAGKNGYSYRCIITDECSLTATSSKATLSVTSSPSTPATITGVTKACSYSSETYSISPVSGATSYIWTIPSGATKTADNGTSITVKFGTSSGNVTVKAKNSCFTSAVRSKAVTVIASVPAKPGIISSPLKLTPNSSYTFSIAAVSTADSYLWTVPSDCHITGGQGTTSISVIVGSRPGSVTVKAHNCKGYGPIQSKSLIYDDGGMNQ